MAQNWRRQTSIGNYPTLSLKEAREAGEKLRNQVAKGLDPIEVKAKEKGAIHTIKDLGEKFIKEHCKKNKKSWKEDERTLNTYILTQNLSKLHPKDITRKEIKSLLNKVVKDNGKVMANRVFAFINTMFRYALNEEENLIEHSPCFAMKKPGGKEKKKTRYLKDDEIVIFWKGLDDSLIAHPVINALKLILLTGQRSSEICGIHSDEINGHWWSIPGERTKNGLDHSVYLTDFSVVRFEDCKQKFRNISKIISFFT